MFRLAQGMDGMNTGVAFWRPLPVAGYCSLGDLVTCGCSIKAPPQPTWSAVMVRDSGALVLPPKAYKKVRASSAATRSPQLWRVQMIPQSPRYRPSPCAFKSFLYIVNRKYESYHCIGNLLRLTDPHPNHSNSWVRHQLHIKNNVGDWYEDIGSIGTGLVLFCV